MKKKKFFGKTQKAYLIQILTVILSLAITVSLAVFITLYVKEKKKSEIRAETYTVTFDANGGLFPSGGIYYTTEATRDSLIHVARVPKNGDKALAYWSTDKHGTAVWYFETETVSKNVTLYAVWRDTVNVTFDANGGALGNGGSVLTVDLVKDSTPSVQTPVLGGFEFVGWFAGDNEWNGVADKDLYLKAKWVYRDNAALAMPVVTKEANGFHWQAVGFAKGYAVRIENSASSEVIFDEVTEKLSYLFAEGTAAGEYKVSVAAVGDGETAITSEPAEFKFRYKCLGAPIIYYDTATNTVHWLAVENAETYAVYVNDVIEYEGTETGFKLNNFQAGATVRVAAAGAGYYPSKSETAIKVKKLKTPVFSALFLTTEGNLRLTWTESHGADSYELDFGSGKVMKVNAVSYEFPTLAEFIVEGKFSVKIRAINSSGKYLKSDISEVWEFILDASDE